MMSSGYMMGAIAEEKENRTIEMLTTTVSPSRLITGKILGTVGIGLTIFITWILVVVVGMFVASQLGVDWFENMAIDWRGVMATTAIAIPAFVLVAALMTAIGAMVRPRPIPVIIRCGIIVVYGVAVAHWLMNANPMIASTNPKKDGRR